MLRTFHGVLGVVDHNLGNVGTSAPCYCRETAVYKDRQHQAFAVRFLLQRAAQRLRDRSLFFAFSIHDDVTRSTLELDGYRSLGSKLRHFSTVYHPPVRFSPKCRFSPTIRHFGGHLDNTRHIFALRSTQPEDHNSLIARSRTQDLSDLRNGKEEENLTRNSLYVERDGKAMRIK